MYIMAQAAVQAGEELRTRLEQAEMVTEKEREEESLSKALRAANNTGKKLEEVNTRPIIQRTCTPDLILWHDKTTCTYTYSNTYS